MHIQPIFVTKKFQTYVTLELLLFVPENVVQSPIFSRICVFTLITFEYPHAIDMDCLKVFWRAGNGAAAVFMRCGADFRRIDFEILLNV